MANLRKSELRKLLLHSINILKPTLDYEDAHPFLLTLLFAMHAAAMPTRYGGHNLSIVAGNEALNCIIPHTNMRDVSSFFATLEQAYPALNGLLTRSLPAAHIPELALDQIAQALDDIGQLTGIFDTQDAFAQGYEWAIEQIALKTIKRGRAFYTQRPLMRLMIELIQPRAGMSLYDPAVGTGGAIIEADRYVREHGAPGDSLRYAGRELDARIWALCKLNLLAHDLANGVIEEGDSLNAPPAAFDLVVSNLPIVAHSTTASRRAHDAFFRHALTALAPAGKAALLTSSRILHEDHRELWQSVLERDWLEALIVLPPKLLQGTTANACLFLLNRSKAADHQGEVLLMHSSAPFAPHTRYHTLSSADHDRIVRAFGHWHEGGESADMRIVPNAHIAAYQYRLEPSLYLDQPDTPADSIDLASAVKRYQAAVSKREAAMEHLLRTLDSLKSVLSPKDSP